VSGFTRLADYSNLVNKTGNPVFLIQLTEHDSNLLFKNKLADAFLRQCQPPAPPQVDPDALEEQVDANSERSRSISPQDQCEVSYKTNMFIQGQDLLADNSMLLEEQSANGQH